MEVPRVVRPGFDKDERGLGSAAGRRLFVVGFDPGTTTGWAALRIDLEMLVREGFRATVVGGGLSWRAGLFGGRLNRHADLMMALLRGVWLEGEFDAGGESDAFVAGVEGFILRMFSMAPELLDPVRVIAKFEYLAESVGLDVPWFVQSASEAMSTVTDERLRAWGMWRPGPEHPRDALRQAVLLARRFVDNRWRMEMLRRCRWLFEKAV